MKLPEQIPQSDRSYNLVLTFIEKWEEIHGSAKPLMPEVVGGLGSGKGGIFVKEIKRKVEELLESGLCNVQKFEAMLKPGFCTAFQCLK